MATKKEQAIKLPKGKRAVISYEAKDGSLHRKEHDRDIHDARNDYNAALVNAGDYMAEQAPYVDDWQCKAIAGSEEFQRALEDLMTGFAFEELIRTRQVLNDLVQSAAQKKRAEE
jgi:hypothetical protein